MTKLSRVKLLVAGAVLVMLGLRATPAESSRWCMITEVLVSDEQECISACQARSCPNYSYDGFSCICY